MDWKNEIIAIRESQVRMEMDLKYHIKRTDMLEEMVRPIHKLYSWGVMTLAASSVIYGLYKLLELL